MATETTRPEQLVRDYEAWVNGDISNPDAIAESVDVYNPGLADGEVHGRDAYRSYIEELKAGVPDFEFEATEILASEDTAMVEFRITGTHEGDLKGIPPTGHELELRGMETFEVSEGKIQEMRAYFDTAEIPEQLGLTFPEIVPQLPKLALGKLR